MEISNLKFACLDTETTGLSPQEGGRVCEVAVSVSQGGKVLREFSTLINPQMPIHPDVVAIHGITSEMVKEAPLFQTILPDLTNVLEGCVLVAHNADFDLNFLKNEYALCGQRFPNCPVIDTVKLARKSGMFVRNRLGVIADAIGISNQGWHRAMADTKMCEQILYHFLTILCDNGISTLQELQKCQFTKWKDLGINIKEIVHE